MRCNLMLVGVVLLGGCGSGPAPASQSPGDAAADGAASSKRDSSDGSTRGDARSGSVDSGTGGLDLTPVSFKPIPDTDPDLVAPGRGAEFWNGVASAPIDIPTAGMPAESRNYYNRFLWSDFEDKTQGRYDWSKFDQFINQAIDAVQSFSFAIMPVCDGCGNVGYGYPTYVHTLMQGEAVPDWLYSDGTWIPNWNSDSYLSNWENLLNALAAHIKTGSDGGHPYSDAIYYVDIRGYGNWGEWHSYPWYCGKLTQDCNGSSQSIDAGAIATSATLKRIIDSHRTAFPTYPLVALIGAFDGGDASLMPADVSYYALSARNTWGAFGWRRDNWGDPGYTAILDQNTGSYMGMAFKTLIMSAWKGGPVVGEPENSSSLVSAGGSCDFYQFPAEVALYHATSFGNGNIPDPGSTCAQANVRAASRASGYRLVLDGGGLTGAVGSDRKLGVRLLWKNMGIAPPYEDWNVVFELRTAGNTVVWSANSSFVLKLFLPQSTDSAASDTFILPSSVAHGSYTLTLTVRDPLSYRKPLPLAIQGQAADGSYSLGNVTVP